MGAKGKTLIKMENGYIFCPKLWSELSLPIHTLKHEA